MLRTAILSVFVLLSTIGFSQSSPWVFGINHSFDYNYRQLVDVTGVPDNAGLISVRNDGEAWWMSSSSGVFAERGIAEHFALQAGLNYANMGHQRKFGGLVWEDQIDATRGFVNPTSEDIDGIPIKTINKFSYVGLPLQLRYNSHSENISFISGIGITAAYLTNSSLVVKYQKVNGDVFKKAYGVSESYNAFNLLATASVGAQFRLKGNFSIRAEMIGRYGVLKILDDTNISAKLFNTGLNLSVCYSKK